MKILWIVTSLVTLGNAGVVPWTHSGEEYAAKLFLDYCLHTDHGVNGNVHWFCKQPQFPLSEEVFEHYKEINGPSTVQKQVIFVQAPARTYKHKVFVKGQSGVQQDTNVYVIPAKNRHQIEINGDIQTHSAVNKPHTFYLKKNPVKNAKPTPGYEPEPYYPAPHVHGGSGSPHLSSYRRSRRRLNKKEKTAKELIDPVDDAENEEEEQQDEPQPAEALPKTLPTPAVRPVQQIIQTEQPQQ